MASDDGDASQWIADSANQRCKPPYSINSVESFWPLKFQGYEQLSKDVEGESAGNRFPGY